MSDNNDEENNNLLPQTLLNSSSIQKFEKDKFYKYRSNNNINDYYDNNKPFATWKLILLIALTLQNATEGILLRYIGALSGEGLNPQLFQFQSEILKLIFSIFGVIFTIPKSNHGLVLKKMFFTKSSLLMIVPALLYLIQNILGYTGYEYLPIPTIAVLGQTKLVSAAFFGILLLNKRYSRLQWKSLIQIIIGAMLVVQSNLNHNNSKKISAAKAHTFWIGLLCILISFSLSGLIAVYVEKVLKSSDGLCEDIWSRNVQLSTFTLIIVTGSLSYTPSFKWSKENILASNHSYLYYIAVLLSACGGILVAYCLKYTDAIYKSFAQSGAIITKTSFAIAFFGAPFSFLFALGTIDVFLGISNYNHLS
jgi:solute carrier family 35 (UDP-sugar transporter), member A1/2/3